MKSLPSNRIESAVDRRLMALDGAMHKLMPSYALQFFMIGHFPEADRSGLLENLLVSNWPADLLVRYEATDMFRQSRIVAKLKESILPVCSDALLFARARDAGVKSRLAGVFYDDGFANTIGLSLHDAHRRQYLMLLSGPGLIVGEQALPSLVFELMKALDGFASGMDNKHPLSARELDCLRWSAAGKSSEEIALILDLSSHTVNSYMRSAIEKLDVVNRVQAVATACRLRLI